MKKNKTVEYGKYGLLFLIPFFLVFLVFQLYPLLYTFYNSFIYSAKNGRYVTETVGLGNFTNYVFAKTGSEFWQSLMVTVVLWILNFIPQILLATSCCMVYRHQDQVKGKRYLQGYHVYA